MYKHMFKKFIRKQTDIIQKQYYSDIRLITGDVCLTVKVTDSYFIKQTQLCTRSNLKIDQRQRTT